MLASRTCELFAELFGVLKWPTQRLELRGRGLADIVKKLNISFEAMFSRWRDRSQANDGYVAETVTSGT